MDPRGLGSYVCSDWSLQCSRVGSDEVLHPLLGLSVFGSAESLFAFQPADDEVPRSLDEKTPILSCQIEELSIRLTHIANLYLVVHSCQIPAQVVEKMSSSLKRQILDRFECESGESIHRRCYKPHQNNPLHLFWNFKIIEQK